jgi:hypothetical protein
MLVSITTISPNESPCNEECGLHMLSSLYKKAECVGDVAYSRLEIRNTFHECLTGQ